MSIFYQQPYELLEEPRVKKVRKDMGCEAVGLFLLLHYLVKKGTGMYPLEAVMLLADGKPTKVRRLRRLLTEFDLFVIENGMVSLRPGLNTTDFIRRDTITRKAQRAAELSQRDYSDELFPDAAKAMDQEAAKKLNDEIRARVMCAVENASLS